jgi:C4-dicarboxylate-specific signal transduction histidine kinase
LGIYVTVGVALGIAYVLLDQYLDARMLREALPPIVGQLHAFVDIALPMMAGALFGVGLHYLELRASLARDEARRADELGARLTRVERDQAVWVVVASVLHEIKNPLHSVGLLLDEAMALGDSEAATRAELQARMQHQLTRMQKHVDTLRGLSERSRPTIRPVELVGALRSVASDLLDASGPPFELRGLDRAWVAADPTHLRIILENLLTNALEAVEREPKALIRAEIVHGGGCIELRLENNGPAIRLEERAALFEPLATSKVHGLGLGLAIARTLARSMAGDLTLAEASPATSFTLSLPESEA